MNRLFTLCAASALALPLAACNQVAAPAPTHDDTVKAIQDLEAQWVRDYAAKDPARLAAYYADDAVLMVPGSDPVSGKDAISKEMTGMVSDPAFALKFHPDHVDAASSGDVAWSEGTYTIAMTDPESKQVINDHGSYVTVYKKQSDGSWKAVSDIANSATPPAPPAPVKTTAKKK
ncbi:MAG TPA: SgcJ/EcaC family oxidoreductase [Acidobacteriaceae bacterium]|nr:SgcJ/EcaC family oxidoreductase [Acidobacteriaceae bacterium]